VELREALGCPLETMGVAAQGVQPHDLAWRPSLFCGGVAGKQLLLLLDNNPTVGRMRPLPPGASHGLVLIAAPGKALTGG